MTRAQARRIGVRAQMLDARRPTELLAVVRQLTMLQVDPTAAIAPSADLVAWSRLGLRRALENGHVRLARVRCRRVAIGGVVGTRKLTDNEGIPGESGRMEKILADDFKRPAERPF